MTPFEPLHKSQASLLTMRGLYSSKNGKLFRRMGLRGMMCWSRPRGGRWRPLAVVFALFTVYMFLSGSLQQSEKSDVAAPVAPPLPAGRHRRSPPAAALRRIATARHHRPSTLSRTRPHHTTPGPWPWKCDKEEYKLFMLGRVKRDLVTINSDISSVLLITPVRFLRDGPVFKMALPHPCVDAADIVGDYLQNGNFQGIAFTRLIRGLLHGMKVRKPHRKRPLVVDIGANLGLYTLWPAALGARVVSIELQKRWAEAIEHSALANGWLAGGRVAVHNVALGRSADIGYSMLCVDQNATRQIESHALHSPGRCRKLRTPKRVTPSMGLVPFATLDSLVPEGHVDLMKVDCDGCEDDAYEGMIPLLKERRISYMMVEAGSNDFMSFQDEKGDSWLIRLVRKFKPRVYITTMRVLPEGDGGAITPEGECATFLGIKIDKDGSFVQTAGTVGKNVGELEPGSAWKGPGFVEDFSELEDFMKRCDPVQIDALFDLRG